jgi:hypothetical protein
MYHKIGILAVLASVLLSAALLATPTFKVANAQENQTEGNQTEGMQTQGIDVDRWIVALKQDNPTVADIEQDPKVKDVIESRNKTQRKPIRTQRHWMRCKSRLS